MDADRHVEPTSRLRAKTLVDGIGAASCCLGIGRINREHPQLLARKTQSPGSSARPNAMGSMADYAEAALRIGLHNRAIHTL